MEKGRIMFYSVIALIVLAAINPGVYNKDPELMEYVNVVEVLSNGNLKGPNAIGFVEKEGNNLASCHSLFNVIVVNKTNWYDLSEKEKVVVMAHEMIHCDKGFDHKEGLDELGCGESIMNPAMRGRGCVNVKWDDYVEEMRTWE